MKINITIFAFGLIITIFAFQDLFFVLGYGFSALSRHLCIGSVCANYGAVFTAFFGSILVIASLVYMEDKNLRFWRQSESEVSFYLEV